MRTSEAVPISDTTVEALYREADAARWHLTRDVFGAAVRHAVARLGDLASVESAETIAARVHVADLALALGCAVGDPDAWDHFVLTYRPELYRAARAMTDDATGRELADSLYADLFGLTEKDGERRSLFRYYHGRAKLSTWLRSVLAQRHVDLVRAARRTTSLDDERGEPADTRLAAPTEVDPVQRKAMAVAATAVSLALAGMSWDDRRRLAWYYVHGLKLAAIGRAFGESEATASRKLERVRQQLRAAISQELATHGGSVAEIDDWAAVAREAWDAALTDALGVPPPQGTAEPSFKGKRTP